MFPVPAPFGVTTGHLVFEKVRTCRLLDVRHVDGGAYGTCGAREAVRPVRAVRAARPERGTFA